MYRIVIIMIAVLFAATPARAAATAAPEKLEDLYLGEVLYYAFQEDWFEAISRLDGELAQYHRLDEPQLDTLYPHIGLAEFAVGDFELAYRMHQRPAGLSMPSSMQCQRPGAQRGPLPAGADLFP